MCSHHSIAELPSIKHCWTHVTAISTEFEACFVEFCSTISAEFGQGMIRVLVVSCRLWWFFWCRSILLGAFVDWCLLWFKFACLEAFLLSICFFKTFWFVQACIAVSRCVVIDLFGVFDWIKLVYYLHVLLDHLVKLSFFVALGVLFNHLLHSPVSQLWYVFLNWLARVCSTIRHRTSFGIIGFIDGVTALLLIFGIILRLRIACLWRDTLEFGCIKIFTVDRLLFLMLQWIWSFILIGKVSWLDILIRFRLSLHLLRWTHWCHCRGVLALIQILSIVCIDQTAWEIAYIIADCWGLVWESQLISRNVFEARINPCWHLLHVLWLWMSNWQPLAITSL